MKKDFYIYLIYIYPVIYSYMGVGQTAWVLNNSTKKNETYVVTKLFPSQKKNVNNNKNKSKNNLEANKSNSTESIFINKNTVGFIGI